MAKAISGYMGPVIGKLGPAVGYLWKGRPVFRAYVPHINYPNTVLQQAERDWFIGMVRMAAASRSALLLGLREAAAREQMTEGNLFVKLNKSHFRRDGSAVDYSRLVLSEGPVAPVSVNSLDVDADGVLTVNWQRNNGMHRCKGSDSVHLFVYNSALRQGLLAQPAPRRDGTLSLSLPDGWHPSALHPYLFATDTQGHSSPTVYAVQSEMSEIQTEPCNAQHSTSPRQHRMTDPTSPILDQLLTPKPAG